MQQIIEQTVTGLGYDLVAVERTAASTLRVTIDLPWLGEEIKQEQAIEPTRFINTEDCEKVTRQLQFVFEVEGIDYKRLEISSPGLDRELTCERDFWRFQNYSVDLTLKHPISVAANGVVAASRKKFRGVLRRGETSWQLLWDDVKKPSATTNKKTYKSKLAEKKQLEQQLLNVMNFEFDEIRDARLVAQVSFKGQQNKA